MINLILGSSSPPLTMQDHVDSPAAFCCYTFLLTLEHKINLFNTFALKMKVNRICGDSTDDNEMMNIFPIMTA